MPLTYPLMDYLPYIGVAAFIGGLIALILWLRKKKTNWIAEIQKQVDKLVVQTVTPAGVFVLSEKAVLPALLTAIDTEFAVMMDIAARYNWTNKVLPTDYTILIFPSVRDYDSNGTYSPSFKVYFGAGDSYDESPYDQMPGQSGGYLLGAEWVIDLENCRFVIAENNSQDYTRACVHHGMDHLLLYHNDRQWYQSTADHSQGGSHPILT